MPESKPLASDKQESPRHVLITAGAAGIGAAVARRFSADGDRIHVCDINDEGLKTLAEEYPQATTSVTDLGDANSIHQLFSEVDQCLGHVDVLVNCAGVKGPVAPAYEISLEEWRNCLAVNLDAIFLCSTLAYKRMKKGRGASIVNLSSTYASEAGRIRSPYITSKNAVNGLTRALACDFGAANIRVNAVAPGAVSGSRIEEVLHAEAKKLNISYEQARHEMEQGCALSGLSEPEEIAEAVHWLASPAASRVTGQILQVDGGSL